MALTKSVCIGCGFIGEHVDYFCDCWCVSDGEGRKIENMVSRMR